MKVCFEKWELGSQCNCSDCNFRYEGRGETTSKAIAHAKKTGHKIHIQEVYAKVIPKNYYTEVK